MLNLKNKTMALSIALLLTISMGTSMLLLPNANAHTPAWQIPTYCFLSVSPNPIGVGQSVNVNFWVNLPPPTAGVQYGDRWHNITVLITKPDGTTETLGPFTSDDTGGAHTSYTPSVTGNYTFQMSFGGEVLAGANPVPGVPNNSVFIGDYYQPSKSNVFHLTVQQEPISYEGLAPLPTNFWTRPIYAENNHWYSIAGNWLGLGLSQFATTGMYNASGNYNPYTTAPNTAHIIWTKPVAFGGTIGGEFGGTETGNYYSTSQYEPKFAPIILQGILYYTMYPGASTTPVGWSAVDLRTGETIWTKNTTEPLRCGQLLDLETPNQYGAIAYLWSSPNAKSTSSSGSPAVGNSLEMWDAMTGSYVLSITNANPAMVLTSDDHGDLVGYYVNSTGTAQSLSMWNSTRCINLAIPYQGGPPEADSWSWRPPLGAEIPFSLGIQWSVPLPNSISGVPLIDLANGLFGLGLSGVNCNTVLLTEVATPSGQRFFQPGWQIETAFSADTGIQLWGPVNRTQTEYARVLFGSQTMANNVYVEFDSSLLSATGYSLTTGDKLWGPVAFPNVSPFASLGMNYQCANGTIYLWTYGGDVYAFDLAHGNIKWQYHTPTGGYESPYGVEPLWTFTVGTVADGKLFVPEGHMYSPPLFHNAQQLALNITDGSLIWSIDAFDVTSAPAICDGVMTTLNAYDNQLYAWSKGPTVMSVTAPKTSVDFGRSVIIEGSVIDNSPGTQQLAVASNFPNGLPAVSDESMTLFMEAVYMQKPMPNNITGVPVSISVLDSNGNFRQIGTATSDGSGMFTFTWKPDIPGDFTVVANFDGSEAYYSSHAETSFVVESALSTATPPPQSITLPPFEMYLAAGVAAIIIAIAIVGVLLATMLKKRP